MTTTSTRADELTEAMLAIVAAEGLEGLSVRTVADRCGVSIGTVQYHFPTKEAMLAGAFERVVNRVADRISEVAPVRDTRTTMVAALQELVPLDDDRLAEARVVMAFAAAAATRPALATIQAATLDRLMTGVAEAVAQARGARAPGAADRRRARLAIAAADGLTLHAVSAPGTVSPAELRRAIRDLVDALLPAATFPAATNG